MKIKKGNKAIDFTATDIHGNEFKLSDFKGKKIILTFMRNVSCPFCNVRIHRLMGTSVALKHSGVQMILIFESTPERLKSSVLHKGIMPWPVIGNFDKKLYKLYNVEKSLSGAMKTMFVAKDLKATMALNKTLETTKEKNIKESTSSQMPADFFINEDFTIEMAHYGTHGDDHIELNILKKFADIRVI